MVMHNADEATAQCALDVLTAYNQLNSAIPTLFIGPVIGNGDTLIAGIYRIAAVSTLDSILYLNARGSASAVCHISNTGGILNKFKFQNHIIERSPGLECLLESRRSCKYGTGYFLKGTIIANNDAISISYGK